MPTIQDLASAMFTVEGTGANDLNHRNNNPGNLIFVGQTGAVKGEGGFAKFGSWQDGIDAAIAQISLDLKRGTDAIGRPTTTLSQLIKSWSTTDQASYTSTVAGATGIDPNADLASQLAVSGSGQDAGGVNFSTNELFTGVLSPIDSLDFSNPWVWGSGLAVLGVLVIWRLRE